MTSRLQMQNRDGTVQTVNLDHIVYHHHVDYSEDGVVVGRRTYVMFSTGVSEIYLVDSTVLDKAMGLKPVQQPFEQGRY